MTPNLVFLWGPPRSLSTAFVRMMMERGDFVVYHEPFSSVVVQGFAVIGGEKVTDVKSLIRKLVEVSEDKPVFVKETTEYRYDMVGDPDFLRTGRHSFIIRDPRRVIPSHFAMNPEVKQADIGFENMAEIFDNVHRSAGYLPAIVEAEELAEHPEKTVRNYCEQVGIPFIASALHWQPGDREEWSRTSEWHQAVARSAGFSPPRSQYDAGVDNHPRLAQYYIYHLPFYERLRARTQRGSSAGWTAMQSHPAESHQGVQRHALDLFDQRGLFQ